MKTRFILIISVCKEKLDYVTGTKLFLLNKAIIRRVSINVVQNYYLPDRLMHSEKRELHININFC